MALTKEIEVGQVSHVMGDQYSLPVTIKAMDGVTEVFSRTVNVDYKTNQTLAFAFSQKQVVDDFQKAIDAFKQCRIIQNKTTEIQDAALSLLNSLIV